MGLTALADHGGTSAHDTVTRRLFVAWQDPSTRRIIPVGRLDRRASGDDADYEFRYLRRALRTERFRPFVGFPDLHRTYRSSHLFPFFENRVMPRARKDYSSFVHALGLEPDADPFEILAVTEGRRQTDTIEVFPEPTLRHGIARCRFLVHGVRHVPNAQEAIERLAVGEQLFVLPDPQNPVDRFAVLLRDGGFCLLGWVPEYLTDLVNLPLAERGPESVEVTVLHIGGRHGPSHLRLMCAIAAEWPESRGLPLSGDDFAPVASA